MHGGDRTARPSGSASMSRPDVAFRTVDGTRVRYAQSNGRAGPSILLTSPWPESIYAFTPMWPLLTPRFRLFAVDLPGFGASERRDGLLAPEPMGTFLARVIEECGLDHPPVVAPGVGTAAAL